MALYPGFPLAKSDYMVGKITLSPNSKSFTLSGANPIDFAAATAGDEIYIPKAGKVLLIETISNTGGTLLYNCPTDCAGANQNFHLRLKPSASRLQGMVTTLLQKLGSGTLAAMNDITLSPNHVMIGDSVAGQIKTINFVQELNKKASTGSNESFAGKMTFYNEIYSRAQVAFRLGPILGQGGNEAPGTIFHKNANNFYILLTDENAYDESWNNLRPFTIKLTTGDVTFGHKVEMQDEATFTKKIIANGEIEARSANGLRFIGTSSPSVIARKDGSNFYLLLTDTATPNGNFNSLRPFGINLTTGRVTVNEGLVAGSNISITNDAFLNIGTASYRPDGSIKGSVWEDWHSGGWAKTAIDARINAAKNQCVTGARLTDSANINVPNGAGWVFAGVSKVITGIETDASGKITKIRSEKPQVRIGSNWVNFT